MTRIPCPSESWDDYVIQQERANFPKASELLDKLDAYGHLTWFIGFNDTDSEEPVCECSTPDIAQNAVPTCKLCKLVEYRGDWLASFDVISHVNDDDDELYFAYHVVINSDSSNFITTSEQRVVHYSKAPFNLPDQYAIVAMEEYPWSVEEVESALKTNDHWNNHLQTIIDAYQLSR